MSLTMIELDDKMKEQLDVLKNIEEYLDIKYRNQIYSDMIQIYSDWPTKRKTMKEQVIKLLNLKWLPEDHRRMICSLKTNFVISEESLSIEPIETALYAIESLRAQLLKYLDSMSEDIKKLKYTNIASTGSTITNLTSK